MTIDREAVQGFCAPGYEELAQIFSRLFSEMGEQGAAVCIYKQGRPIVNLWGGTRDKAEQQPWQQQTQVNIFSASKGLVALCVLKLVEEGALDLDAPVASYWPEFAVEEKSRIRVRDVLCHRSGLSAFHSPVADEAIYDWDAITKLIAAETPWWQPGTTQGYSPMIFGWLLGELVRRASGADSFNAYFQKAVAEPLQIQCSFGVDEAQLAQLADVGPLKLPSANVRGAAQSGAAELGRLMKADPKGVVNKAFTNPMSLMMGTNSPAWRQAEIPAANAHASAQSLAAIYGALANGGEANAGVPNSSDADKSSVHLLQKNSVEHCWREQSYGVDKVLGTELRFSQGFMLSMDRDDCRFGPGERGFGHPGAGGCLGFGDPDSGIGFGYVTNRMGQGLLIDCRAKLLIDALYRIEGTR